MMADVLLNPVHRNKFNRMAMKNECRTVLIALALTAFSARAGLFDQLQSALTRTNTSAASPASSLSQDQMTGGLKEALGKGVEHAVAALGHDGGFLTNLSVKIPMPGKLQTVEKALRLAGQNQLADDFVGSMNHAAEQAVPAAAGVFGDAIKQMTIEDARGIISGPDDSATQYFRKTTRTNLFTRFYPVVQKATDEVGVTAKYKQMMSHYTSATSLGSMFGSGSTAKLEATDIDTYVTDKAMDGLYKMVAEEEKNIRSNPVARTSDLLQKVFGRAAQ
jgi:hypothetical protein